MTPTVLPVRGLFVFAGAQSGGLRPVLESGDLVRVTGGAQEFFTQTQVNASSGTITILGDGPALPQASTIAELPEAAPAAFAEAFVKVGEHGGLAEAGMRRAKPSNHLLRWPPSAQCPAETSGSVS